MNLDVDFLIDFFRKHTPIKKNKPLDEQDASPSPEPAAAPAPAPLPLFGAAAAFGWSRRIRKQIKQSQTLKNLE